MIREKINFDQHSLEQFWAEALTYDQSMRDLKFVKDHLGFYRDLTVRVLAIAPTVRIRINRSQYAFYDDLDIGPFCSFAFFKSKFALNPMRLKSENVKDLNCDIFSFEGKTYRMGGTFYAQFFNWDVNDLNKAAEVAKRSFDVKEKVGPAPFFGDLKKRGV